MTQSRQTPAPGTRMEAVSAVVDQLGGALAQVLAASAITRPQFIRHAMVATLYQIEAAKTAQRRARRPDVREFARTMQVDYDEVERKLRSFIGGMNSPQMPPESVDALHQILLDDLCGATNEAFDQRYIAQQKIALGEARTLFKTYHRTARDDGLRSLIGLALPVLEQHMQMVRELEEMTAAEC